MKLSPSRKRCAYGSFSRHIGVHVCPAFRLDKKNMERVALENVALENVPRVEDAHTVRLALRHIVLV